MTSQVLYYANAAENLAMLEYAESIGLTPVPPILGQEINRECPESGPFIYLSALPQEELHPYGPDKNKISDATDPLLFWLRSYIEGEHLISGNVTWSDDAPQHSAKTKKQFGQLKRWLKRNFSHFGSGMYISPGAEKLKANGLKLTSIPPSASIALVEVRRRDT